MSRPEPNLYCCTAKLKKRKIQVTVATTHVLAAQGTDETVAMLRDLAALFERDTSAQPVAPVARR